jgi:hypothetical protein
VRATVLALVLPLASASAAGPADLVPLAPTKLAQCRSTALLRAACPRLVPRVRAAYLDHLSVQGEGTRFSLAIFNLERGAEYPEAPERNAPPRMAHLVVVGGRVEQSAAGVFTNVRRVAFRAGLMRRKRDRSLGFGTVRWAGRVGQLSLAPSYPRGGMLGNHLLFRWRAGRRDYVVSVHAWEPLADAAATLRAVVTSAG